MWNLLFHLRRTCAAGPDHHPMCTMIRPGKRSRPNHLVKQFELHRATPAQLRLARRTSRILRDSVGHYPDSSRRNTIGGLEITRDRLGPLAGEPEVVLLRTFPIGEAVEDHARRRISLEAPAYGFKTRHICRVHRSIA